MKSIRGVVAAVIAASLWVAPALAQQVGGIRGTVSPEATGGFFVSECG